MLGTKDCAAALELRELYQVVADDTAAMLHQIRVIDESREDDFYPEDTLRRCVGSLSEFFVLIASGGLK